MRIQVTDKNSKVVSVKGVNIELQYFVTHLSQRNLTTQTKISTNNCSLFIINANLCVIKLFKLSLYHQSLQFKNLQTKEFSGPKNC